MKTSELCVEDIVVAYRCWGGGWRTVEWVVTFVTPIVNAFGEPAIQVVLHQTMGEVKIYTK